MDVMKLSPAPWTVERRYSNGCEIVPRIHCPRDESRECGWVADLVGAPYLGHESSLENAEAIAMMRNDFDVKQRRGWHTEKCGVNQWCVPQLVAEMGRNFLNGKERAEAEAACYQEGHDIGLLSRADAWMKQHEGKER